MDTVGVHRSAISESSDREFAPSSTHTVKNPVGKGMLSARGDKVPSTLSFPSGSTVT
jgi:hypothetical protein